MLLKSKDRLIRVLEEREGQKLIVSCIQKSMPVWISERELQSYVPCEEAALSSELPDYEELSPEQRRYAHERYTLIAGVIPFLGDKTIRCETIERIASSRNISKQTIRYYLYLYLKYQNIAALAPPSKKQPDQLTRDEKNMRWAINKFYYTRHKNSLTSAYTQMLKHKYCDASGILLPEYPSIHQFRYFYRKTRNWQTYYISREGMKSYQRNNRPLLGDGIQEFASSIGTGIYRDAYWRGGAVLMSALSAVEMALWDILGKTLGVPVYQLLGGKVRDKVRIYVNGWFAGAKTPEQFAEKAKLAVSRGVTAMKWDPFGKSYMEISGKDLDQALSCIAAVREAVGSQVDFLCVKTDGDLMVRECIQRKYLLKPLTVKLLDVSRTYWMKRGVEDWGLVIDAAEE